MPTTLPKAARGASFKGYLRITQAQLARLFRNPAFRFTGFIVGNKVSPAHYFGGWHLACRREGLDSEDMRISTNAFLFYLDAELGNRAVIFVRRSAIRRAQDPVFVPSTPLL